MSDIDQYEENDDFIDAPSKSKIKRDMLALREMGERLSQYDEAVWQRLELPATLCTALDDLKRIKNFNARKRQSQYIGKLIRKLNSEELQNKLTELDSTHHRTTRAAQLAKQWSNALIAVPEELEAFLTQFSHADRQQLRSLLRAHSKASDTKKPAQVKKINSYLCEVIAKN